MCIAKAACVKKREQILVLCVCLDKNQLKVPDLSADSLLETENSLS